MAELDLIVRIAEIILFVVLAVLGIYLILSVKKINRTADNVNKTAEKLGSDIEEIKAKLIPLIENTGAIAGDIKHITGDVKLQVAKVDTIVDSFKDTADSIIQFEQKAQKEIESQVFETLNVISAVTKGVKTFFSRLSASRNGSPRNLESHYYGADSSEEDY